MERADLFSVIVVGRKNAMRKTIQVMFNSFVGFVVVLIGIIVIIYALIFQSNNILAIVILSVFGFFLTMWGGSYIFKQFFKTDSLSKLKSTYGTKSLQDMIEKNNETLSTNYDTVRNQASISFIISNILFVLGFLIICASLFLVFPSAKSGTSSQGGVKELGVFAGIMTEFISGTAILIYRDCLTNLNVSIQVWGLTEGKKSAVGRRETTVSKG
jgi:hypothetical protein